MAWYLVKHRDNFRHTVAANELTGDRWVACMNEIRNAYKVLVGKREQKIPLARPKRKWGINIRMDHREIGWECVDWMHLAQNRDECRALVNTVMSFP
jgi:hypothetical protein